MGGNATAMGGRQTVGSSRSFGNGQSSLSVANRAALVTLSAANRTNGTLVWVDTYRSYFVLDTSSETPEADTIINANGAPTKQWIRLQVPYRQNWNQTSWSVSPATGSNEGTGLPGDPLASLAEWRRRVYRAQWSSAVTLTLVDDIADADDLTIDSDGSLTVQGTVTVLDTQTVSFAQARNAATNVFNEITMPVDWSSHVGRFVRVQGTSNYASVIKNVGANVIRLSELWNTSTNSQAASGGVTAAQVLEVISQTKGPLQCRRLGRLSLTINDVRFDGVGATGMRETRDNVAAFIRRCIFGGTTFSRQHPNGDIINCCMWRQSAATCNWLDGGDQITGAAFIGCNVTWNRRMKIRSAVFQASFLTMAGAALHVDGDFGQCDLTAGQVGILLPANDIASKIHFNSGRHYGNGNSATAWVWDVQTEAMVSYLAASPPTNDAGLGVRINGGNVAIGALPVNLSLTNGSAVYAG